MPPIGSTSYQDCIHLVPPHIKSRINGLKKAIELKPNDKNSKIDLFHLATSHLYFKILLPSEKKIMIVGNVFNDGVGDYYHLLSIAEEIKRKFLDAKITLVVNHYLKNLAEVVRKPSDLEIKTIFYEKEIGITPNYAHIYPLLDKADLILEVSQETSIIDHETKLKCGKYTFIGEYGLNIYEHNDIYKSMGLTDHQLGIFIKEKPQIESLCNLENKALKTILFNTTEPTQKDLESYLSTHEPYIGYLKSGSYYQMAFIYTTAALLKTSEKQILDLIIPEVKTEYLDINFLINQGIGKISSISVKNGEMVQNEVLIAENGKELRLINPFPLDQKDFYKLLTNTNPLVGCTGDHSLSETISFDRYPFYELRSAKLCFFRSLIALAEKIGKPHYYLKEYLQEIEKIFDRDQEQYIQQFQKCNSSNEEERNMALWFLKAFKGKQFRITESSLKMAHLLQKPEIIEEFKALNELVKTQYSFNPSLINIVEQQLSLNGYPSLKNLENELRKKFLNNTVTLKESIETLNEKIKDLTTLASSSASPYLL